MKDNVETLGIDPILEKVLGKVANLTNRFQGRHLDSESLILELALEKLAELEMRYAVSIPSGRATLIQSAGGRAGKDESSVVPERDLPPLDDDIRQLETSFPVQYAKFLLMRTGEFWFTNAPKYLEIKLPRD